MVEVTRFRDYVVKTATNVYNIIKRTLMLKDVASFLYRDIPSGIANGYGTIEKIEGNTLVWNQFVRTPFDMNRWNASAATFTKSFDSATNTLTLTSTENGYLSPFFTVTNMIPNGHICFIYCELRFSYLLDSSVSTYLRPGRSGTVKPTITNIPQNQFVTLKGMCTIANGPNDTETYFPLDFSVYTSASGVVTTAGSTLDFRNVMLHDLTTIFGAGNEPTTVAEFEALYPLNYYDYNAGELISNSMSGIETYDSNNLLLDSKVIDVTTITGINSATNQREVCFPDGMNKVGSVIDELSEVSAVKRMGVIALTGSESWTANIMETGRLAFYILKSSIDSDSTVLPAGSQNMKCSHFSISDVTTQSQYGTIFSGGSAINFMGGDRAANLTEWQQYLSNQSSNGTPVTLAFPISTPITYTDLQDQYGNPIVMPKYEVEQGGTEEILPVGTASSVIAAPTLDIVYNKDKNVVSPLTDVWRNIQYKVKYLTTMLKDVASFLYRAIPSGIANGYGTIEKIEGNTLVWNQLIDDTLSISKWGSGATFVFTHTSRTYAGVCAIAGYMGYYIPLPIIPNGHKMFISVRLTSSVTSQAYNVRVSRGGGEANKFPLTANTPYQHKAIETVSNGTSDTNTYIVFEQTAGSTASFAVNDTFEIENLCIIDLTQMFGAGNEPTTVAEFEARYPLNFYDFNAGQLIANSMSGVKSVGFNLWDEDITEGGITDSTGLDNENTNYLRSSYVRVIPNSTIYVRTATTLNFFNCYFYGANFNYLGASQISSGNSNRIVTVPSNAYYMRFLVSKSSYGNSYNHDICISLSNPALNGTYKPYLEDTKTIDVTTITGINSVTNQREVCFPNGLNKVGSVMDELNGSTATKRIYAVNLGSLSWIGPGTYNPIAYYADIIYYRKTSNVPSQSVLGYQILCAKYTTTTSASYTGMSDKTIGGNTDGSRLIISDSNFNASQLVNEYAVYELETPITYTDLQDGNSNPLVLPKYNVQVGGTEQILPVGTASSVIAASKLEIVYNKPHS